MEGFCLPGRLHLEWQVLNSGVFFRCLPGKYQQGYEYQIQNGYKDNDRTKPADYGTGAIYNRVKARKVVPNDHEWFTMTLIANGNHISTWVNGYQTVDWTDTRPPNDNARNGCKLGTGPISLQGHDKTTDLSFRNLRDQELKKINRGGRGGTHRKILLLCVPPRARGRSIRLPSLSPHPIRDPAPRRLGLEPIVRELDPLAILHRNVRRERNDGVGHRYPAGASRQPAFVPCPRHSKS